MEQVEAVYWIGGIECGARILVPVGANHIHVSEVVGADTIDWVVPIVNQRALWFEKVPEGSPAAQALEGT